MLTETIISARGESYGVITPTGVNLRTFVSEDCGAASLSTGIATFVPRSYLPYHLHAFSEAITVLEGAARILIEGRTYILSERDCIHVPAATAHQVENADKLGRMVALWAFASAKPTRTQVEKCFLLEYRGYGNPKEGDPESIIRFDQCPVYELSENASWTSLRSGLVLKASAGDMAASVLEHRSPAISTISMSRSRLSKAPRCALCREGAMSSVDMTPLSSERVCRIDL